MKSSRFNFGRALSLLCAIFFVSFSFISCQQEEDTEIIYPRSVYDLQGTWSATYANGYIETYILNLETNTFDAGTYSYAGDTLVVRFIGTDYGYIYIKFTRSADENWNYTDSAPDVGKWYAVAFRKLKDTSVDLSGAYLATGVTSTDTLEEAISTFTIDNGYFASYSSLTKE